MARYLNGEQVNLGDVVVLRARVVGLHPVEPFNVSIETVGKVGDSENTSSFTVSSKQLEKVADAPVEEPAHDEPPPAETT